MNGGHLPGFGAKVHHSFACASLWVRSVTGTMESVSELPTIEAPALSAVHLEALERVLRETDERTRELREALSLAQARCAAAERAIAELAAADEDLNRRWSEAREVAAVRRADAQHRAAALLRDAHEQLFRRAIGSRP